jgi:hypothetical protein
MPQESARPGKSRSHRARPRQRPGGSLRTYARYLTPSAALIAALALTGCSGGGGGGGGAAAAGGGGTACQKMPSIWKTFLAADHSDAIDAYNNLFGSISDLGAAGEITNQQLNSDLYNLSAAANNLGGDYADNDGSGPAPADVTEFKTEAKAVSADCGISLALPSFG